MNLHVTLNHFFPPLNAPLLGASWGWCQGCPPPTPLSPLPPVRRKSLRLAAVPASLTAACRWNRVEVAARPSRAATGDFYLPSWQAFNTLQIKKEWLGNSTGAFGGDGGKMQKWQACVISHSPKPPFWPNNYELISR